MVDKFEIGEKVLTSEGVGWIELINRKSDIIHYLVRLSDNRGIYYFNNEQVFKYEK